MIYSDSLCYSMPNSYNLPTCNVQGNAISESETVKGQGHPRKKVFSVLEIDKVLTSKIDLVLMNKW